MMDAIECIKTRRSVRQYENREIPKEILEEILEAARWTPSGKNGQPWRFRVVKEKEEIRKIANLSVYGPWMQTANCFVAVFLDKTRSYSYVKDVQGCGAWMQTMMLAAHALGVGSCWIGEILPKEKEVKEILGIQQEEWELMGIVTLGYPKGEKPKGERNSLDSFVI